MPFEQMLGGVLLTLALCTVLDLGIRKLSGMFRRRWIKRERQLHGWE